LKKFLFLVTAAILNGGWVVKKLIPVNKKRRELPEPHTKTEFAREEY
jgi:hypothetical protein